MQQSPLVAVPSAMHKQCTVQQSDDSVCCSVKGASAEPSTLAALAEQCHKKLQEKVTKPASIKAQQCRSCIHARARLAWSAAVGMPATVLPVQWSSGCMALRCARQLTFYLFLLAKELPGCVSTGSDIL